MDIYEILKNLDIDYTKHDHPAVYTVEEAKKYYKPIKGVGSKNLFLRNKGGDRHYLAVIKDSKRIDLKTLANSLNETKLSFASPERLKRYLDLTPGSVSPFGLIHDKNREVTVVIDSDLLKYDILHYHPNINTATLELSRNDFQKFLKWCGNKIIYSKL
jgi:Ala-tRNA(Pro) deacylase